MASIRLIYFALQFFVILLALRSTTAYDVQGTKKIVVEVGSGFAGVEGRDHMKLNSGHIDPEEKTCPKGYALPKRCPLNVLSSENVSLNKERHEIGEGLLENIDAVPTAPEVTNGKIGGRKMMMMMMKEGKLRELVMKQEQAMINEEASTIPGAENSGGNCNDLKVKELKINSTKLSDRRSIHDDQVNVKMGTFMVFNSDYHVAKPHPPKNN